MYVYAVPLSNASSPHSWPGPLIATRCMVCIDDLRARLVVAFLQKGTTTGGCETIRCSGPHGDTLRPLDSTTVCKEDSSLAWMLRCDPALLPPRCSRSAPAPQPPPPHSCTSLPPLRHTRERTGRRRVEEGPYIDSSTLAFLRMVEPLGLTDAGAGALFSSMDQARGRLGDGLWNAGPSSCPGSAARSTSSSPSSTMNTCTQTFLELWLLVRTLIPYHRKFIVEKNAFLRTVLPCSPSAHSRAPRVYLTQRRKKGCES